MIDGSYVRRLIFHLVIAMLTFTVGLSGTYMSRSLRVRPASADVELNITAAITPPDPVSTCEVHGSILKAVRIQLICGEYKGGIEGRREEYEIGCTSYRKRRMLPEDALFFFKSTESLSLNEWAWRAWWQEADAAKEAQFPHGYGWLYQDCESGEERCATIYSCPECRAAELRWKHNSLWRSGR